MDSANLYDVIIIGGGPAGLTGALYLARARYRVLVIEKERFGGQITITNDVVNYPGIERGSGSTITAVMRKQAQSFGAEFLLAEAQSIATDGDFKNVQTSRGAHSAFGLILATGARPRSVGFEGEQEFKGRGVAYCATCDGEFFTGLDVFVVGGGYAAAEEAIFLTKYARQVFLLIREDNFTCAQAVSDSVKQHKGIEILYNTIVESVSGTTGLQYIRYRNTLTNEVTEYNAPENETFGVFVFAGYEPDTKLAEGHIELDYCGYAVTDTHCKTSQDGIYAAGDVRVKNLRQMVTATADGAIAATELERYVAPLHAKTGLIPRQPITRIPQKAEPDHATPASDESFFSNEIKAQLSDVFSKMEQPLILLLHLDERPVSQELQFFVEELVSLTDKLSIDISRGESEEVAPYVELFTQDMRPCGIAFHGVPSGHEFNSFVLGLYNASGPGQKINDDVLARIHAIKQPLSLKILVSLSCTLCPELVAAAQQIAANNAHVRAHTYDIRHFPALKDAYNVMSVPCLVVNDKEISFGKKNIVQILDYLDSLNK